MHYAQLKEEFINKAQDAEYTVNNGKRVIAVEIEVFVHSARYVHTTTRDGYHTVHKEGIKCVFDDEVYYQTYTQD